MFELIAKLIQIVPLIKQLYELIRQIGAVLFPNLSPSEQFEAAQLIDPEVTKRIQGKLNKLGADPQLVVDGHYGDLTKAAARAVQKKFGLVEDGWVGNVTETKMDEEIAKL